MNTDALSHLLNQHGLASDHWVVIHEIACRGPRPLDLLIKNLSEPSDMPMNGDAWREIIDTCLARSLVTVVDRVVQEAISAFLEQRGVAHGPLCLLPRLGYLDLTFQGRALVLSIVSSISDLPISLDTFGILGSYWDLEESIDYFLPNWNSTTAVAALFLGQGVATHTSFVLEYPVSWCAYWWEPYLDSFRLTAKVSTPVPSPESVGKLMSELLADEQSVSEACRSSQPTDRALRFFSLSAADQNTQAVLARVGVSFLELYMLRVVSTAKRRNTLTRLAQTGVANLPQLASDELTEQECAGALQGCLTKRLIAHVDERFRQSIVASLTQSNVSTILQALPKVGEYDITFAGIDVLRRVHSELVGAAVPMTDWIASVEDGVKAEPRTLYKRIAYAKRRFYAPSLGELHKLVEGFEGAARYSITGKGPIEPLGVWCFRWWLCFEAGLSVDVEFSEVLHSFQ